VFNEAIARGEVSVLTDSFAHREDSEPKPLRHQYDESALMARRSA
jgi:kumamolisin